MNKHLLESEMKANGDTGGTLAKYLGIARSTFSAKLNETNGAEFTQGEISAIISKYNLDAKRVISIFFTNKVSKIDTV